MAVATIRWRVPTPPPVAEIVNAAFRAAALDGSPLFHAALTTARTGVIASVLRVLRSKKRRQTKVKMAIAAKFNALCQRIDKYSLTDDSNIALRLELLEADITDKLLTAMEK